MNSIEPEDQTNVFFKPMIQDKIERLIALAWSRLHYVQKPSFLPFFSLSYSPRSIEGVKLYKSFMSHHRD